MPLSSTWQCTTSSPRYSDERPNSADLLSRTTAENAPCPVGQLVLHQSASTDIRRLINKLHPFAINMAFGTYKSPTIKGQVIPVLPPHCYQLSQARTSTLLRDHLPPHIASISLESPLEPLYPAKKIVGTMQGFPG